VQTKADSDHLNRNLSKNFKAREFICPCCKEEGIEYDLVLKLQVARDSLPPGTAIIINSAYRCGKHNKAVGGVENSAHVKGLAADIRCNNSNYRFFLTRALLKAGFKRIGTGETFIHCDLDETKDQNVIWNYK
jgi:uncharacterized protein YcbK (DUF882 family)